MIKLKLKSSMIIYCIIVLLLIQAIPSNNIKGNFLSDENELKIKTLNISWSEISISEGREYSEIICNSSSSNMNIFGQPVVPIITKTFILPFGSRINSIDISYTYDHSLQLKNYLKPASHPIPRKTNDQITKFLSFANSYVDASIYSSSEYYPSTIFDYTIGCGLHNGSRAIFLSISFYPIRYTPSNNTIYFGDNAKINVSFFEPESQPNISDEYDMVIICPLKFKSVLQRLVLHKNVHGIKTRIKTVESIYMDSLNGKYDALGRDKSEKIKLFIKYAIEEWNISYVLLVGGHKNQRKSWYVPVRYSNLHDRSFWNDSYITDQYYADIYRYNQSNQQYEFEDWDSNKNNIIGEWTWIFDVERGWWYDQDKKDDLDLFPDVYIGRLACRDIAEVRTVVNKIIKYEQKTSGKTWFKNIICVGGDTVPYSDGICEGEIETNIAADLLSSIGFNAIKLWVTNEQLTGPNIVRKEINKGAGFIYLSGHGTPFEWCTHPIANGDEWIDVYAFQLNTLINNNRLPICVVGGCHNSQFDVALSNLVEGIKEYGLSYFFWDEGIECFSKWTWAPKCWSWNLVSQKNGGFIAAIGNTGLGWGVGGENCIEYNEGYLTTHFFEFYYQNYQNNIHNLGIMHTDAINDYILHFSANDHVLDRKTVEQWILLGDPSLSIGGIF